MGRANKRIPKGRDTRNKERRKEESVSTEALQTDITCLENGIWTDTTTNSFSSQGKSAFSLTSGSAVLACQWVTHLRLLGSSVFRNQGSGSQFAQQRIQDEICKQLPLQNSSIVVWIVRRYHPMAWGLGIFIIHPVFLYWISWEVICNFTVPT